MTLIGCPPSTAKWHSPEPQGSEFTLPAPLSTSNGQFISACVSMSVCIPVTPSSVPDPFDPVTHPLHTSVCPLLHSHFLLNMCSFSHKSLQFSSFCPPCYVSCLHKIGCSVCFFFSFCFLPMSHWQ